MSILSLVLVLVVIGVLLYLLNNFLPLDPKIRLIINVVVVVAVCVWLLSAFGVLRPFAHFRV